MQCVCVCVCVFFHGSGASLARMGDFLESFMTHMVRYQERESIVKGGGREGERIRHSIRREELLINFIKHTDLCGRARGVHYVLHFS